MASLYIVATPIGNLQDITLRALEVLKTVSIIAAEDTRHTQGLLNHYQIVKKKLVALHEHNEREASAKIIAWLEQGEAVALVSDAGTPLISDPGSILVQTVRAAGHTVVPIPGPNAAICALSASGIVDGAFLFYGFLPSKAKQRQEILENLSQQETALLFYEAPHRIVDTVKAITQVFANQARTLTFARELTKQYETIYTTPLAESLEWLLQNPYHQKGEFVLILSAPALSSTQNETETCPLTLHDLIQTLLNHDLSVKQSVQIARDLTGVPKDKIYQLALKLHQIEAT